MGHAKMCFMGSLAGHTGAVWGLADAGGSLVGITLFPLSPLSLSLFLSLSLSFSLSLSHTLFLTLHPSLSIHLPSYFDGVVGRSAVYPPTVDAYGVDVAVVSSEGVKATHRLERPQLHSPVRRPTDCAKVCESQDIARTSTIEMSRLRLGREERE